MRLLERRDATAKSVELGRRCVKDWKSKTEETGYHWTGNETKMTEYVNHFLEKYRNQATRLGVSSKPLGDAYAESVFDLGYVLSYLFQLNPKTLTTVVLDKEVYRTLDQTRCQQLIMCPSLLSCSNKWYIMMQGGLGCLLVERRRTSST